MSNLFRRAVDPKASNATDEQMAELTMSCYELNGQVEKYGDMFRQSIEDIATLYSIGSTNITGDAMSVLFPLFMKSCDIFLYSIKNGSMYLSSAISSFGLKGVQIKPLIYDENASIDAKLIFAKTTVPQFYENILEAIGALRTDIDKYQKERGWEWETIYNEVGPRISAALEILNKAGESATDTGQPANLSVPRETGPQPGVGEGERLVPEGDEELVVQEPSEEDIGESPDAPAIPMMAEEWIRKSLVSILPNPTLTMTDAILAGDERNIFLEMVNTLNTIGVDLEQVVNYMHGMGDDLSRSIRSTASASALESVRAINIPSISETVQNILPLNGSQLTKEQLVKLKSIDEQILRWYGALKDSGTTNKTQVDSLLSAHDAINGVREASSQSTPPPASGKMVQELVLEGSEALEQSIIRSMDLYANNIATYFTYKILSRSESAVVSGSGHSLLSGSAQDVYSGNDEKSTADITTSSGNTYGLYLNRVNYFAESSQNDPDFRHRILSKFMNAMPSSVGHVSVPKLKPKNSSYALADEIIVDDEQNTRTVVPSTIDTEKIIKLGSVLYKKCEDVKPWTETPVVDMPEKPLGRMDTEAIREYNEKRQSLAETLRSEYESIANIIKEMAATYVYHGNSSVDVDGKRYPMSMFDMGLKIFFREMAHVSKQMLKDKDNRKIDEFKRLQEQLISYIKFTCPWTDKDTVAANVNALTIFTAANAPENTTPKPLINRVGNMLPGHFSKAIGGSIGIPYTFYGAKRYSHRTPEFYGMLFNALISIIKNTAGLLRAQPVAGDKSVGNIMIGNQPVVSSFIDKIIRSVRNGIGSARKTALSRDQLDMLFSNDQNDVCKFLFGLPYNTLIDQLTESISKNSDELFKDKNQRFVFYKQYQDVTGKMLYDVVSSNGLIGAAPFETGPATTGKLAAAMLRASETGENPNAAVRDSLGILYGKQISKRLSDLSDIYNRIVTDRKVKRGASETITEENVSKTIIHIPAEYNSVLSVTERSILTLFDESDRVLQTVDGSKISVGEINVAGKQYTIPITITPPVKCDTAKISRITLTSDYTSLYSIQTGAYIRSVEYLKNRFDALKAKAEAFAAGGEVRVSDVISVRDDLLTLINGTQSIDSVLSDISRIHNYAVSHGMDVRYETEWSRGLSDIKTKIAGIRNSVKQFVKKSDIFKSLGSD